MNGSEIERPSSAERRLTNAGPSGAREAAPPLRFLLRPLADSVQKAQAAADAADTAREFGDWSTGGNADSKLLRQIRKAALSLPAWIPFLHRQEGDEKEKVKAKEKGENEVEGTATERRGGDRGKVAVETKYLSMAE